MLDPDMWHSESFRAISSDRRRLAWICLISQADDEGKGKSSVLATALGAPPDEIKNILTEFEKLGLALGYQGSDGLDIVTYYQIPKWFRYQRISHPAPSIIPNHPNFTKIIPKEYQGLYSQNPFRSPPESSGVLRSPPESSGILRNPFPPNIVKVNIKEVNNLVRQSLTSARKPERKKEEMEMEADTAEVIAFLNERCQRNFSVEGAQTKYIRARLREGTSKHDLKLIVEYKAAEWLQDKRMKKYLRPATLFCPKHFEDYLDLAKQWDAARQSSPLDDLSWEGFNRLRGGGEKMK